MTQQYQDTDIEYVKRVYIARGLDQQGRRATGVHIAPPAANSAEGCAGDDAPAKTGCHTTDTERAYRIGAGIALLVCAGCVALSVLSVAIQALQK